MSEAKKDRGVTARWSLLSRRRNTPIFNPVLTNDENWLLYEAPKRCRHCLSSRDPVPQTTRQILHTCNIVLCNRWTSRQVVHYKLLLLAITADLYSQQFKHLQQTLQQKKPALANRKGVLLFLIDKRGHIMYWWSGILCSDLSRIRCVIYRFPRTLN